SKRRASSSTCTFAKAASPTSNRSAPRRRWSGKRRPNEPTPRRSSSRTWLPRSAVGSNRRGYDMIAYKFLKSGAVGLVSGFRWPTPGAGSPGDWVEARAPVRECEAGIHVCRAGDLPYWMHDELWAIEIDGEAAEGVN